jgi:phage repressor protein C with HTH and peptisase S24 domain
VGKVDKKMHFDLGWRNQLGKNRDNKLVALELDQKENSMYPTIKPGDILIIDKHDCPPAQTLKKDGIYLLYVTELNCTCLVKRVRQSSDHKFWIFFSDNPDYDPIVISREKWPHPFLGRIISSCTNHLK